MIGKSNPESVSGSTAAEANMFEALGTASQSHAQRHGQQLRDFLGQLGVHDAPSLRKVVCDAGQELAKLPQSGAIPKTAIGKVVTDVFGAFLENPMQRLPRLTDHVVQLRLPPYPGGHLALVVAVTLLKFDVVLWFACTDPCLAMPMIVAVSDGRHCLRNTHPQVGSIRCAKCVQLLFWPAFTQPCGVFEAFVFDLNRTVAHLPPVSIEVVPANQPPSGSEKPVRGPAV
jgi:hypothetical protein